MKQIVIVNHLKKQKKLNQLLQKMVTTFEKNQNTYEIHFTKESKEANAIITSYNQPCRFYICGGDGTLHQVLQALIQGNHELVLIPCGTGNDFSRMLKHKHDIFAHFADSFNRKAKPIDVLKVNQTYAINAACFALDNDIALHVHDPRWSFVPHKLSYLITVLRRVFIYSCNEVSCSIDGTNIFDGQALFLTCNNAKYYGGGFCFTPQAKLDDGKLDICIISKFPRWKILYKCPALFMKKPNLIKECQIVQGQSFTITSKQGMNLDGEFYPDETITIQVLPKALKLVNEIKESS